MQLNHIQAAEIFNAVHHSGKHVLVCTLWIFSVQHAAFCGSAYKTAFREELRQAFYEGKGGEGGSKRAVVSKSDLFHQPSAEKHPTRKQKKNKTNTNPKAASK